MDTLEFLQRILPSEGFYCAFLQNKRHNEFFDSIESLTDYVLKQDRRGQNIYYAISTFKDDSKRTKNNTYRTRVLTLDIDAKGTDKCYDTVQNAAKALAKFLKAASLPNPYIVYSGNGLHVYWILSEDVEPDRWNPLNESLRSLATKHHLKIDLTPSKNGTSLVLRPLGTHNPKGKREVQLIKPGVTVKLADAEKLLLSSSNSSSTKPVRSASKLLDSLAVDSDLPPADADLVTVKCQQVRQLVDEKATLSEPEWYTLLGVAGYCEKPEDTARAWSEGHPGYDPAETIKKMYQWKDRTTGPATCQNFEGLRPEGCKGCPYKGTISTPVRLGTVVQEVSLTSTPDTVAQQVPMPKPFKRTASGIYVTISEVDTEVCPFDLYPVGYGKDESLGYEVVRYHWNRPHKGWQELKFRQAYLADGNKEFATAIADQGIVLRNKTQTGYFHLMLRSYMDELRKLRGMSNLYASMGWKEDYSQFLVGNTLVTQSGEEEISLANTGETVTNMYKTKGKLEDCVRFTSLIDRVDLPWIGNALLFALATPLFEFTGLRGMTLSLYGPTGSGKTLTQLWQQSLFGDPNKTHGTAKFTQNALFSRMATLRNLPVTVDEATLMNDKDFGEFVMWTTQGKDKARLDRNSNEREIREWFTTVTISTNRSMTSLLLEGNMESNAQLARVLELHVHRHQIFEKSTEAGRKIFDFVTNNYGHIGKELVKQLVKMGETGVRAAIDEAKQDFKKSFGKTLRFTGDERFWENALTLMYVVGRIADQHDLIAFDYKRTILWQLKEMNAIRREIKNIKKDSMDYLSEYLNEFNHASVTVIYTVGGKFRPVVDEPATSSRHGVYIRFELYKKNMNDVPDSGVLMVDKSHFRRWITSKSGDYREFVKDMDNMGALAFEEGRRQYLTKHTSIRTGQARVVGLNLSIPELSFMIENKDREVDIKLAQVTPQNQTSD